MDKSSFEVLYIFNSSEKCSETLLESFYWENLSNSKVPENCGVEHGYYTLYLGKK